VFVIFAGIAEYIGNDHRIFDLAKPWQFFFYERPSTNILQSNGIQHSSGRFVQARRRIADHRLFRESLYDKAAQAVEMNYVFKLNSIAEGAAGGNDWVLQLNPRKTHCEVGAHVRAPETPDWLIARLRVAASLHNAFPPRETLAPRPDQANC